MELTIAPTYEQSRGIPWYARPRSRSRQSPKSRHTREFHGFARMLARWFAPCCPQLNKALSRLQAATEKPALLFQSFQSAASTNVLSPGTFEPFAAAPAYCMLIPTQPEQHYWCEVSSDAARAVRNPGNHRPRGQQQCLQSPEHSDMAPCSVENPSHRLPRKRMARPLPPRSPHRRPALSPPDRQYLRCRN